MCKGCDKQLLPEEKYTYSNKAYCLVCYTKKFEEHESYTLLLKTICDYFNLDSCTGLMLKQIKQYKDEFTYSYDGMSYTLWYCKEILKKQFIEKYGIALLKYEYENAKKYFEQQSVIQQSTINQSEIIVKKVIKTNHTKHMTNYLIDIDAVIKDGDMN